MNETIQTIKSLRTIHGNFSDKQISAEDLNTILHAAVCAANASARQSYSIIVVSDKEKMRKLTEYAGDKLLVFCVDFTRIRKLAEHLGHEFDVCGMLGFITGSTDTILAAQTACIAAKSLGIDSLFTQRGLHRRDISKVFDLLDLPDKYCFPLVSLVLGYPQDVGEVKKGRLFDTGIIHQETYHNLTPQEKDAIVAQYDDKSKHLGLIDNWEKFNMKHYLDWFYKKWSFKFDTASLIKALTRAGFLPA